MYQFTRVADKSLAWPTSRCILFDGENISFDATLVVYIYIYMCVCVCVCIYSVVISAKLPDNILAHSSTFRR